MSGVLAVLTSAPVQEGVTGIGLGGTYSSIDPADLVELTFQFNTDGTWTAFRGAGDGGAGSPLSGNWYSPTTVGIGSSFDIKFTPSNQVNSPNETNGAAAYTQLNLVRSFKADKTNDDASLDLLIEIAPTGTGTPTTSDSTSMNLLGGP